jgi:hypothetical protein
VAKEEPLTTVVLFAYASREQANEAYKRKIKTHPVVLAQVLIPEGYDRTAQPMAWIVFADNLEPSP